MNSIENVLEQINHARLNGDFELVKRLSKKELENPRISDEVRIKIMDEIAHMYLDSFLIWINEIKKIDISFDKYTMLGAIAIEWAKFSNHLVSSTPYMKELIDAAPEDVREIFLSVDADVEAAKKAKKNDPGIL